MSKKKKTMRISQHTPTQELRVSLILLSPLSSVCSLSERGGGLLARCEICKDNENLRGKHKGEGLQETTSRHASVALVGKIKTK